MARATLRRRRNQGANGLAYGEWIPVHAVKFHEDGKVSLMTEQPQGNRGRRRRNASEVVETIHEQLLAQGLNPRLNYVAWDQNTLKVSKGENGALIHYDRGRDLYDVTEYHGFDTYPTQKGLYVEELFNAVTPTLSPRRS